MQEKLECNNSDVDDVRDETPFRLAFSLGIWELKRGQMLYFESENRAEAFLEGLLRAHAYHVELRTVAAALP